MGPWKGCLSKDPIEMENSRKSLSYPVESGSGNIKISSKVVIADFVD